MEKSKRIKENKAVTLIALVVTIVVLIILAGISISALTGDKGIINQVHTAKENTEIASWEEQIDLAIIDAEKKYRNPTLDDVKEELKNKGVIDDYSQVSEKGVITTNEPVYEILGKLDDYISYIPQELEIGETVIYEPVGSYEYKAEYYGGDEDKFLTTNDSEYTTDHWRVLDIDKKNETIMLVPSEPLGDAWLFNAQGYNNGVKLLNDTCSNLYGYGGNKEGISARNINIEDIEYYMTDEAKQEVDVKYKEKAPNPYTENKSYPILYKEEKKSVINSKEKTLGLEISEQDKFVIDEQNNNGILEAEENIQPYNTHWGKESDFLKGAFRNTDSSVIENYYDLIMPQGDSTSYGIASRYVHSYDDSCTFGIFHINEGAINKTNSLTLYESYRRYYRYLVQTFPNCFCRC